MRIQLTITALSFLLVTGCLKTRAELDAEQSGQDMERQTQTQQRENAREAKPAPVPYKEKAPATAYRFEEYDEQMRQLGGRVDTLENHVNHLASLKVLADEGEAKNKTAQDQKFVAYEDALKKLETQVQQLSEEVTRLKTAPVAAAPVANGSLKTPEAATGGKLKTPYDEGEELFTAKKWKEAIVSYQKYRDVYPKGRMYTDSTYKIGICFQELGMKDEAKAFFEEVIAKAPKSKEAKKASFRMKSLK